MHEALPDEDQAIESDGTIPNAALQLVNLIDSLSLPGSIFVCTRALDGSVVYLSRGCFALTGYPPDKLTGSQERNEAVSYNTLIHPEDLPRVTAAIQTAIAEQQPYGVEYRIRTTTQQEKWIWEKGSAILQGQGQISGLAGFVTDITERKRAEDENALLRTMIQAISEAPDFEAALAVTLRKVCEATGWVLGEAWTPNAAGTRLECTPCWYACTADLQEFRDSSCSATFGPGQGLPGRVWASRQPEWMQDVSQETASIFLRCQPATQVGLKASLAVPIIANDQVLAVIIFFMFESRHEDRQLVELVSAIAAQLGSVIQRKYAETALQEAEAKYRSIFENAVEGIFQTTLDGYYLTANPMLAQIYGYDSPAELMVTLTDITHQLYVDPHRRAEFIQQLQATNAVWGFESQIYRKDGSVIWISENARTIRDPQGQLVGYEGTVEDITQRKQAEAELQKREALLQGVADAAHHLLIHASYEGAIAQALAILGNAVGVDRVYIYENHPHDPTGEIAMSMRFEWNQTTVEPSITKDHWQNQPYRTLGVMHWYETLAQGHSISGRLHDFSPTEQEILQRDHICSILMVPILVNQQFWGYIGFDDCHSERLWSKGEESILVVMAASIGGVLKREQAEETIRYQAFHDLLTGLPNRMLFNDCLPLSVLNACQNEHMLAVMFLDLDRFKTINDTLGHAVGDRLLQSVAQRLTHCLRSGDMLARWGGDEFTLLLPKISSAEDAAKIAQRLLEALKPAFYLEGQEFYMTSSIGIALYPNDGQDVETLLRNADAALYQVKEKGRNNYQLYTPAINSQASERLALESLLYHALEQEELVVYYQPQVNIKTRKITRMEALVRWQHPSLGLILPNKFIPLAEENGLVVGIDNWVLRAACRQNKLWQAAGLPPVRVAVNLSARQFQQPHLVETIMAILAETGLDPEFLEVEITETACMQNPDLASQMLQALQQQGVYIAMDDFGSGYSSLNYLKKFPIHTLKVDRTFIQELITNPYDQAIITAVLALGRGLNLNVVAEGVETVEQLNVLRSLQCEEIQGYLFSPAMPAAIATDFLHNYHASAQTSFFYGNSALLQAKERSDLEPQQALQLLPHQ